MSFQEPVGAPPDELVVATPELVAFRFETAGLGSRFAAQVIDVLLLLAGLFALAEASVAVGALLNAPTVAAVVGVVGGFLGFWAFWILPEALWSGRTVGKRVLNLRVIDARGGPATVAQAVIRNLLRVVDFLPYFYAVGTVAIFCTARNQRLGDLAAGTVVVRERMAVRLADLPVAAPPGQAARPALAPLPGRRLDPRLERFVRAYAQRRPGLSPERRLQLAREVEPALRTALPDVVAAAGPLAALDQLADRELRGP